MAPEPSSSESSSSEFFESSIPPSTNLNLQTYQSTFLLCPAHNSLNSRINSLKTFRNSQPLLPNSALLRPSFGSASITSGTEWPQRKRVCPYSLNLPPCLLPRPGWFYKPCEKGCYASCIHRFVNVLDSRSWRECLNYHRDANTGPPDFITLCARAISI